MNRRSGLLPTRVSWSPVRGCEGFGNQGRLTAYGEVCPLPALRIRTPTGIRLSHLKSVHCSIAPQTPVTKLAEDRAEQLKRDPDKLNTELDARLRGNLAKLGDFYRVHRLPATSADVPDSPEASLVVLGSGQAYSKEEGNSAEVAAKAIFELRGTAPRIYRNSLVFLAADKTRLQDLEEAICKYLAWESVVSDRKVLI
jgi:hypothetical protein